MDINNLTETDIGKIIRSNEFWVCVTLFFNVIYLIINPCNLVFHNVCVWQLACNSPENLAVSPHNLEWACPIPHCTRICHKTDPLRSALVYTDGIYLFLQAHVLFFFSSFYFPVHHLLSFSRVHPRPLDFFFFKIQEERFLLSKRLWSWNRRQTMMNQCATRCES